MSLTAQHLHVPLSVRCVIREASFDPALLTLNLVLYDDEDAVFSDFVRRNIRIAVCESTNRDVSVNCAKTKAQPPALNHSLRQVAECVSGTVKSGEIYIPQYTDKVRPEWVPIFENTLFSFFHLIGFICAEILDPPVYE